MRTWGSFTTSSDGENGAESLYHEVYFAGGHLRRATVFMRNRPKPALVALALAGALLVAAAHAEASPSGIAYSVEIAGVSDAKLRATLEAVSRLIADRDRLPSGSVALRRRIEGDLDRFGTVLRSEGYYGASIGYRIASQDKPRKVTIQVDPGPRYRLLSYAVVFAEGPSAPSDAAVSRALEPMPVGSPARAADIVAIVERIVHQLQRSGYPLAGIDDRKVVVDHDQRVVTVTLHAHTGPAAVFGDARLVGGTSVREVFVRHRLPWKKGDRYDVDLLEVARSRLAATGVFATVHVEPAAEVDSQGAIPIRIEIEQGKPRSVGAGVSYSSSEGTGVNAFWEHRNLLGGGERLRFEGRVANIGNQAHASYREPDFLSPRQALLLDASYDTEDTDAYRSRRITTSAGIERELFEHVVGRVGISAERSKVERGGEPLETFYLVGTPLELRRDSTDNLLDPTRGNRLDVDVVPYMETLGSDLSFVITRLADSQYLVLDEARRVIIAARATVGSISGAGDATIPADKRFYAGGGGSVRGYGYQLAGPLDASGDPIGGRSLVEVGSELRLRMTKSLGGVLFLEGGNVFDDVVPDFGDALLWGTGVGLRYYTAAGPIRMDLGFPLKRRSGIDDAFQIYLSLGQAF